MIPTGNETDLFNLALGYLAVNPVTLWTEDTKHAQALRRFWRTGRLSVLRRHHWKSASKRAALAPSPTAPLFGFSESFELPADFVLLCHIENDSFIGVNYARERMTLHCDATSCNILYIYDDGEVDHWDATLFDAVATFLAHQSAFLITGSTSLSKSLYEVAMMKIADAQAIDGQEQSPGQMESNAWTNARA